MPRDREDSRRGGGAIKTSPIYDAEDRRDIYLTGGFGMYTFLSHRAYDAFANSVPFVDNIFISKTDVAADRVFIRRSYSNSRSLSGVIAHETAHLFIRKRYGTVPSMLMPTWKVEGYCEYVAGDSTIPLDEGVRRWRENPTDDAGFRYTKYHLMVKHLLENEKLNVEEIFDRDLDEEAVAERTLAALQAMRSAECTEVRNAECGIRGHESVGTKTTINDQRSTINDRHSNLSYASNALRSAVRHVLSCLPCDQ